jgi:hypothetical protein
LRLAKQGARKLEIINEYIDFGLPTPKVGASQSDVLPDPCVRVDATQTGNDMRLTSSLLAVSALAACALFAGPSLDTGSRAEAASSCNSGTWRETQREGGACCMPDHYHYSTGTGSSKAAAMADAVANWAGLVVFEYGNAYGHFGMAHSKSVSCSSSSGWSCSVEARPCRRG